MRQTVFVFAIMASLLMLACAATATANQNSGQATDPSTTVTDPSAAEKSTFETIKDTIMGFVGPFLKSGVLTNFKLSSLLGLFDRALEDMKMFGNYIEELHEKCLKEQKELESIRDWAKTPAGNAKKSDALNHKISFLTSKEETGQKQIKEIEKQKEVVEDSKKEADSAIKEFDTKQAMLVQMIVNVLTADKFPTLNDLMGIGMGAMPVVTGMFSSFKKVNKASTTAEEAFQAAKQATKSIKQYLKESQEIEKSLQTSDLKHTARRAIVGPNGTVISDVSFGFSLIQNAVFLTLVAAFLIADKHVW